MNSEKIPDENHPTFISRLLSYLRSLRSFFADKRVSISGLLLFAYAAGIVSAFYIKNTHPVAVVHPGPYALLAIYKGNVYELIPMEESVRLRHMESSRLEPRIQKVGQIEPYQLIPSIPAIPAASIPSKLEKASKAATKNRQKDHPLYP